MEILLKKQGIFFLCETSACGLLFFTCPVGIFDLYVPCSALCVFMDGQVIIPFSDLYIYDILILLSHLKSSDRWREVQVMTDIFISLAVGIVASLIAACIYDRIR